MRITIEDDGCWTWKGSLWDGYGTTRITPGGPRLYVHRLMYRLFVGPIDDDQVIDHLCRNRACCHPAHLEEVTSRENTLRGNGPAAVNARKTHCVAGHELAGENLLQDRQGHRRCRTCRREKERARRAKTSAARASVNARAADTAPLEGAMP